MADSFHKLEQSPPLRLTVDDLAKLGDELVKQANVGGEITIKYDVVYEDGLSTESETTAHFLDRAQAAHEDPTNVSLTVHGWTKPIEEHGQREIARSFRIDFRSFGTRFFVSASDPNWGRGAIQTLHKWLKRHSPRYGPLLRFIPVASGALFVLLLLFVVVAAAHEGAATTGFVVVLVLSATALVANIWFFWLFVKNRVLPDTRITREHERSPRAKLRLLTGVLAFTADIATMAALVIMLSR